MAGVTLEQSLLEYQLSTNKNPADVTRKNFTKDLTKFKLEIRRANSQFYERQGESIWPTVARILAPFQTLGKVTSSAISLTPFAPASLILGATLHLVDVTQNMIEAYGTIGEMLEKIAVIMDRLKIHSEPKVIRPELREYIQKMMGVVVEVLGLAIKNIGDEKKKRRTAKRYFQRALLGEGSDVEKKMGVLRGLAETEVPLVIALVNNGVQGIKSSMNQDRLQNRMEKILQKDLWDAMKTHHDNVKDSARDGVSTEWIVDDPKIQQWMRVQQPKTNSAMIWIKAERGTGKSYAASHLVRRLLKEDRSITTYFYVQGHENRQHLASSIFACIASQLVEKSKGFNEIATEALNDTELEWNTETIWKKLFATFLKKDRKWRTFLVIDGLDAADPTEQDIVLSKLKSVQKSTFKGKHLFHVAILARPSLSLTHNIWTEKRSLFQIPEDKIQSDVAKFIEIKLSALAIFSSLTTKNQNRKINQLSAEIKTDFALAGLVITQAQAYRNSERDLMGFLDRPISRDIGHHVGDLLSQVDSSIYHKRNWIATLRWVACACRVLTVNEVLFLRNIDLDSDTLSVPEMLAPKDLKKENQSILTFTPQSSNVQPNESLVTLKSGMLRDYLVQEDNDILGDLQNPYSVQKSKAHAAIAEICLRRLLMHRDKDQNVSKPDIMVYAADHVIDHFRAVRKNGNLEPGESIQLANQIRKLLNDPSSIQRWYDSISKQRQLEMIKLLLHDDEVLERINDWYPNSSLSAHDLYAPFAQLCNRAWMQGSGMDTQFCLLFLHKYNFLNTPSEERSDDIPIEIAELKGDQILHLADKAFDENSGMVQDSDWHLRIADALMEANHLIEARVEYERAEKDPKNWMARYKLALVFAAEGKISNAVQKAQEALLCVPEPDELCQSNIYSSLFGWQSARGKNSDAIDAAKHAHVLDPKDPRKMANYFSALGRAKKWKSVLMLCEKLHFSTSTPTDLTQLLLGWEEGHDIFTQAVATSREYRSLAEEIFKALINLAKQEGDSLGSVWEEYQQGLFFYRQKHRDEEHLRIWEGLSSQPNSHNTDIYALQLQCRALSQIYYENARCSKSTDDTNTWVSKLETLAGVAAGTSTPENNTEDRAEAAMVLGRWRRKRQGRKNSELRSLFRPRICQGIQILEDDDPLNDSDGYAILAQALVCAGDLPDALRVFAAGLLPLTTSSQWTKEPMTTRDSNIRKAIKTMDIPFKCHGKLGCEPDNWPAFYVCRDCLDKSFCVTCVTGSSNRVCDKSHRMFQVYLKGREVGMPMAKFEGSVLEVDKEWLSKLKEKWDITDETKATSSLPAPEILLRSQIKRSTVC